MEGRAPLVVRTVLQALVSWSSSVKMHMENDVGICAM